jgi:hypothetical protein
MCGNPFKSPDPPKYEAPKVEPVKVPDPTPTAVSPTEVTATSDSAKDERRKRGFRATRVADDRNVLTDSTSNGKRTTLG